MRSHLRVRRSLRGRTDEPLALMVNVFDCAVVLALGLALLVQHGKATAADASVPDQRTAVPHYKIGHGDSRGDGTRLGIAYQLDNGEVVFVPEATAK